MSIAEKLITAEEYSAMSIDRPTELVRGRIVYLNQPFIEHGIVCAEIVFRLRMYLEQNALGRVAANDSGTITARSPDTVRGADVSYYSFVRLPKSTQIRKYQNIAPDIAFEVRSPSDRTPAVLEKVDEYLAAGVGVVVVIDPSLRCASVYRQGKPEEILHENDTLTFPEQLPGLAIPLRELFP